MADAEFGIYKREDGQWDWRIKGGNGEIIATSHTQGFRDATDAERALVGVVRVIREEFSSWKVTKEDA